jgi:hypothetical protein
LIYNNGRNKLQIMKSMLFLDWTGWRSIIRLPTGGPRRSNQTPRY